MKQLLILSGKGGTGKTTVAAAFIKLSNANSYADCDVDAPNLHLINNNFNPPLSTDFYGMDKASIESEKCIKCNRCIDSCKFKAIIRNENLEINRYSCEGCGVCVEVCPVNAINLNPNISGELMLYKNDEKVFSTAKLKMGSGTSGLLVTEVKKQLLRETITSDIAIIDGSPGIGCPVIASISGVDFVLLVVEPTLSGINDMERILKSISSFQTKTAICINKYDINYKNSEEIKLICNKRNILFVGEIPYDEMVIKANNNGKTIVDIDCEAGEAIKEVFEKVLSILNE